MTLNDDNFVNYAMKNYDNIQCHSIEEFDEDLKRFLYLKRLFTKYKNGVLNERLILNHLVILYNCFGDSATNMLYFKIDKEHYSTLTTFLTYLERLPETVNGIKTSNIKLDNTLIKLLREL